MKEYHVKLNAHYEKPLTIYADSPEQAAEKLKNILFDSNAIQFSEEDFACGEAVITDSCKGSPQESGIKNEALKNSCCSGCTLQRPVCKGRCGEDGC
ncbi:MAG: hypothetical protein HFG84_08265 [Dorea sp.]|nr:hypothetical protein [Dorea sp.]